MADIDPREALVIGEARKLSREPSPSVHDLKSAIKGLLNLIDASSAHQEGVNERLLAAATAFLAKVDDLSVHINGVTQFAEIHGYRWPANRNWVAERTALQEAIALDSTAPQARGSDEGLDPDADTGCAGDHLPGTADDWRQAADAIERLSRPAPSPNATQERGSDGD